jgi:CubicO group peptidase (beta-lactamase class C family)
MLTMTTIDDERLDHALALNAKLLCSGVFVVGREPEEFITNDLQEIDWFDWDAVDLTIDREHPSVTLAARGISRTAVYNGRQGCTIIPRGENGLHLTPLDFEPNLPDPATTAWPIGDLEPDDPPSNVDHAALEAAFDRALDDAALPVPQMTRALVVVHGGRVIGERYAQGMGPDTRHVSWSSGKSITAALIGILVGEGAFNVDDPAPVAEWQEEDDPRRAIRIIDLLRMSSGLKFVRHLQESPLYLSSANDHNMVYHGAINVFRHSIERPLEYPPNTVWRYHNCDTLTLGALVRRTVEARGENYLSYPQRALFDKIGIRNHVLEVDPWGNFVMTGFDYGTGRDWARFGLLHLWDGVWKPTGERILPEDWVDVVRTPAPADDTRGYGGQFWLNAGGRHPSIPRDAFWAAGAWGQLTMVIPSRDTVIVRLGHTRESESLDAYIDETFGSILAALGDEGRGTGDEA